MAKSEDKLIDLAIDWSQCVRFLTIFPWPASRDRQPGARSLGVSLWIAPAVGGLVGAVAAVGYAGAEAIGHANWLAAVVAVTLTIGITRGLHEDALADVFDAFGGRDRKNRLAIMRDSRIGVFGAIAVFLAILIRLTAIAGLAGSSTGVIATLIAVSAVSRVSFCWMLFWLPPARSDGMGHYAGRVPFATVLLALLFAVLIAGIALGAGAGVMLLVIATSVSAIWAAVAYRRFGGHTGDILGAGQQLSELALWLTLPLWLTN